MNMNIKKRGNKYTYVIDVGVNGERKQKRITKSTKDEVKAAVLEIMFQLNRGTYSEPNKMPFSELTAMWLEVRRYEIRETTLTTYRNVISRHLNPKFGDLPLSKFTLRMLITFVNKMYDEGYSKNYVAKIIVVLKMLFNYAIEEGFLNQNPASKIKKQEEKNTVTGVWNQEEVNRFLAIAKKSSPYYLAYLISLTSGLRRGEVLGLSWDAVNFKTNTIFIMQVLTNDGKRLVSSTKTEKSKRSVVLPSNVMNELKIWKEKFDLKEKELGGNFKKYRLVVSSKTGSPVSPSNLRRNMGIIIEKAKVPKITFHCLRHTHATLLMEQGVHVKIVSERLGHSDIKTTMNRYTHVSQTMQEKAAQIIGNIIK